MSKLVVSALCIVLFGSMVGCGDDDSMPMAGSGGEGGSAGTGDEDAQVPLDGGGGTAPSEFGQLSVTLNDIENMQGMQVIVELLEAETSTTVAGACTPVTSDAFSVTLPITARNSPALCDYGSDPQLPAGDYRVVVYVQEPEVFPAILCADVNATVTVGGNATVVVESYRPCGDVFPDGTYEGSAMSCATASTAIEHISTDSAASIMDFTDVTVTLERNGMQWLETYEDDDCQLQVTREIVVDDSALGFMQFSTDRTYVWQPADCTLTVTAGDMTAEIGAAFAYYQPTTEVRVDDVWLYMPIGAQIRFASAPGIWSAVDPPLSLPCEAAESFVRTWARR